MQIYKSPLMKSLQLTLQGSRPLRTKLLPAWRSYSHKLAGMVLLFVPMLIGCASSPRLLPVVQQQEVTPPANVTVETSQRLREWSNEVQQLLKEARTLLEKLLQDSKDAKP